MTNANRSDAVLLLGGTGFSGSRLIAKLQENDREVYVISRKAHTLPALEHVHRFSDSLDNVALLDEILPQCSMVFHMASTSTPGSSALQPSFEASNNLLPTLRFLETLQDHPQTKLVFLSTGGAIYGNTQDTRVDEATPLSPTSYYGAGKAAIEKFILAYCTQLDRTAIILRPANFYGPGQPYRPGFGVVPTIFHHIINDITFEIWGDGENVRDYLYIDDFVELCLALVHRNETLSGIRVYNVGSQRGVALNQLCDLASQVAGSDLKRSYRTSRAIDVRRIVLNCAAIRRDFGWTAKTSLEDGLAKTWSWISGLQSR